MSQTNIIDKLTPAQIALTETYKNKWIKIGLDTKPLDLVKVRKCIDQVYTNVNLKPPAHIIRRGSPLAGVKKAIQLTSKNKTSKTWQQCGYGSQDASWLSFYSYFLDVVGLECCKKLKPLMQLAEEVGWWWPFENVAIVTDKPSEIHTDAQHRLHADLKPALLYPDGWALYYWHGIKMPEEFILKSADALDIKKALTSENATIRLFIIQKCGFLRLKNQIPNTLISKTDSAELLEFNINNIKVRGLHVKWTDKHGLVLETIIPVPRTKTQFSDNCPDNIDDAEQVRRWTLGLCSNESLIKET